MAADKEETTMIVRRSSTGAIEEIGPPTRRSGRLWILVIVVTIAAAAGVTALLRGNPITLIKTRLGLAVAPRAAEGESNAAELSEDAAGPVDAEVTALLTEARAAVASERWEDALDLGRKARAKSPNDEESGELLSLVQSERAAEKSVAAARAAAGKEDWRRCWKLVAAVPEEGRTPRLEALAEQARAALVEGVRSKIPSATNAKKKRRVERALDDLRALGLEAEAEELTGELDGAKKGRKKGRHGR